jgi:hypothetical protein
MNIHENARTLPLVDSRWSVACPIRSNQQRGHRRKRRRRTDRAQVDDALAGETAEENAARLWS